MANAIYGIGFATADLIAKGIRIGAAAVGVGGHDLAVTSQSNSMGWTAGSPRVGRRGVPVADIDGEEPE